MKSSNVTSERVEQLLASYGSNSNCWPEQERDSALELINQNSHLKNNWLQAQRLDQAMGLIEVPEQAPDQSETENEALLGKILEALPQQEQAQLVQATKAATPIRRKGASFVHKMPFKGMMAAGFALVITAVVTFNIEYPAKNDNTNTVAQVELEQWFWEEIAVESTQHSEEAIDLMAMIDFEQLEDFQ